MKIQFTPKSKIGLFFVAGYIVYAIVIVFQTMNCTGWFCGFGIFRAFLPAALVTMPLADFVDRSGIINYIFGQDAIAWVFIVVTVLCNLIGFYYLGRLVGYITNKLGL